MQVKLCDQIRNLTKELSVVVGTKDSGFEIGLDFLLNYIIFLIF